MSATQLGLDLTPIGAFAVGDRVRILPTCGATTDRLGMAYSLVAAGEVGTVTKVRPLCGPADRARGASWNPVLVLMDVPGDSGREREYAFEHEDLELVDGRRLA